ncbi:dTDP-4-dehydrorhamnose reductase [Sphingobium sp. CCH11-B1]|jgi:dTDP-4-dehydrorhamnose reductase|uniref:dTDP-4-dehydrorhamnose reductase n=1 Tax=Sphingobium sp. CCH11-B1 TaxID=1768781 RepID=UPI00083025E7|nr:dTDP-4-dehydrorhamnose reductase [Sphingobium sp. CCH11-B1]MEA3390674.1 dTDP-4-dehydrorhamnose reductase [Pseudomonadota bacterium]
MKIAVTGTTGQVVTSLLERGKAAGHEVIAIGRPDLDLADPASVARMLEAATPDVIVSAAAYTAVDKAESESDLAFAVNGAGAGAVAQTAKKLGAPVIHISTDYVFDGTLDRPYVETDPTGPTGVYGASKLAGEQAVLAASDNSAVLRVAWVYSPFGGNFVKTMLRLAADRDELGVVGDQVGNPTSALAIADGIFQVANNMLSTTSPELRGIFHMTAPGEASWADFAEAIFAASAVRGGPSASVRHIGTADYPTPATRPANSRLDCSRIAKTHGVTLPDWRASLDEVMDRLQPAVN